MLKSFLFSLVVVSSSFAVEYNFSSGWNLFSPLISAGAAVNVYFDGLKPGFMGDLRKIWAYDSNSGWKSHAPGENNSVAGRFENLEPNQGYWVLMNAAHSVNLPDSFNSYSLSLAGSGWNLVGLNSSQEIFLDANDFLQKANFTNSSDSDIRKIWSYDGQWKSFSQAESSNTLNTLKPGYAFWFLLLSDLEINSQNINLSDLFPPACPGCPSIGN